MHRLPTRKLFLGAANCRSCHHGPLFTDGEFHSIGLVPLNGSSPDTGRFSGVATVLTDPFNGLGQYSDDRSESDRAVTFLTVRRGGMSYPAPLKSETDFDRS
jgi:cytochrome c peroxidase